MYTGTSGGAGFMLGVRASNDAYFLKGWHITPGQRVGGPLPSSMQGSRHQQVAPNGLADRGKGGLGPVPGWTLFSLLLSRLGRLLMCKI